MLKVGRETTLSFCLFVLESWCSHGFVCVCVFHSALTSLLVPTRDLQSVCLGSDILIEKISLPVETTHIAKESPDHVHGMCMQPWPWVHM